MNPIKTARVTEPVLSNGTFAALGASLVPILVYLGVQSDEAGRVGSFVGTGLAVIFTVWHLWSARSKVMPVQGNTAAELLAEARRVLALLQQLPNSTQLGSFSVGTDGSFEVDPPAAFTPTAPLTTTTTGALTITGGVVEHDDGTLGPADAAPELETSASGVVSG